MCAKEFGQDFQQIIKDFLIGDMLMSPLVLLTKFLTNVKETCMGSSVVGSVALLQKVSFASLSVGLK